MQQAAQIGAEFQVVECINQLIRHCVDVFLQGILRVIHRLGLFLHRHQRFPRSRCVAGLVKAVTGIQQELQERHIAVLELQVLDGVQQFAPSVVDRCLIRRCAFCNFFCIGNGCIDGFSDVAQSGIVFVAALQFFCNFQRSVQRELINDGKIEIEHLVFVAHGYGIGVKILFIIVLCLAIDGNARDFTAVVCRSKGQGDFFARNNAAHIGACCVQDRLCIAVHFHGDSRRVNHRQGLARCRRDCALFIAFRGERLEANIAERAPHIAVKVAGDLDVHAAGTGLILQVFCGRAARHSLDMRGIVGADLFQIEPIFAVYIDKAFAFLDIGNATDVVEVAVHFRCNRERSAERVFHGDNNRVLFTLCEVDPLVFVQIDGVVARICFCARDGFLISLCLADRGAAILRKLRINLDRILCICIRGVEGDRLQGLVAGRCKDVRHGNRRIHLFPANGHAPTGAVILIQMVVSLRAVRSRVQNILHDLGDAALVIGHIEQAVILVSAPAVPDQPSAIVLRRAVAAGEQLLRDIIVPADDLHRMVAVAKIGAAKLGLHGRPIIVHIVVSSGIIGDSQASACQQCLFHRCAVQVAVGVAGRQIVGLLQAVLLVKLDGRVQILVFVRFRRTSRFRIGERFLQHRAYASCEGRRCDKGVSAQAVLLEFHIHVRLIVLKRAVAIPVRSVGRIVRVGAAMVSKVCQMDRREYRRILTHFVKQVGRHRAGAAEGPAGAPAALVAHLRGNRARFYCVIRGRQFVGGRTCAQHRPCRRRSVLHVRQIHIGRDIRRHGFPHDRPFLRPLAGGGCRSPSKGGSQHGTCQQHR